MQGDVLAKLKEIPDESVQCCVTSPPYYNLRSYLSEDHPDKANEIGAEKTPEEYVAKLVEVFREVKRVLRSDGVCFINIGDSFAVSGKGGSPTESKHRKQATNIGSLIKSTKPPQELFGKEIIGVPWMLAFALRADGWRIREEIVWQKPNCMTESVKDRPTRSHEYIFMLFKNHDYYYDWIAIAEPVAQSSMARINQVNFDNQTGGPKDYINGVNPSRSARKTLENFAKSNSGIKNARSVWTMNVKPLKEAHTATFPVELPKRCISATTSEAGCCPHCRKSWERVIIRGEPDEDWKKACGADSTGAYSGSATKDYKSVKAQDPSATKARILEGMRPYITTGWKPTCGCPPHEPTPSIVLDPFSGAGTTLLACKELGRDGVGIELNADYVTLSEKRIGGDIWSGWVW